MSSREDAFYFDCEGNALLGIIHVPARPATIGVLIVVGGPQYRVGSHRQFVLLSRSLASSGFASMRFDYRGMGDATGQTRSFEEAQGDVRAAIDAFFHRLPGLQGVVLWGLCDGASLAACYAALDPRVRSLVLANPWVRAEATHARALIERYYRRRMFEPEFWKKMLRARLNLRASFAAFTQALRASRRPVSASPQSLPARMLKALVKRSCPTLFVLSGNDLVAAEFRALVAESAEWRRYLASPTVRVEAREEFDHTFSQATWRDQVADITRAWMLDLTRSF
ncbi:MAG: hypothetical protein RIR70_1027 [Pseudomonadota bacterium]